RHTRFSRDWSSDVCSSDLISAKESAALSRRVKDLGIQHFFPACKDKWAALSQLLDELMISTEEVCFVGDDVIDLKVMKKIGLSIAPKDAFWMVKDHADLITDSRSEERRVGKECRSRWSTEQEK